MFSKFLKPGALSIIISFTGGAAASDNAGNPRSAPNVPSLAAAVQGSDQSAERSIAAAALRAGLQKCRPLSQTVTRFLIGDSKSAGVLFTAPQEANDRIASASIEVESPQSLAYASATYAPYPQAGCGVTYDAVTYLPESCTAVAARSLKSLNSLGTLGGKIAMFEVGPQLRIYLMPAGSGCVQIKKEILY